MMPAAAASYTGAARGARRFSGLVGDLSGFALQCRLGFRPSRARTPPERGPKAEWHLWGFSGPHLPGQPQPFMDAHMITCERCQTENHDGSQYCDECGAMLRGQPQQGPRTTTEDGPRAGTESNGEEVEATKGEAPESSAGARSQVAVPAAKTSVAGLGRPAGVGLTGAGRGRAGAAHAKLVIDRGRSAGKEFLIDGDESHIGRWDADGGIFPDVDLDSDDPEAKVSRRHARITRRGGNYFIEDLGSTNGTFVNRGRRLLPGDRQPLGDGDEVIVGKTFLRFHVLS
jgi:hypothetical protein